MRIDLVYATEPLAGRVRAAYVDREARKGKGPSDHAPKLRMAVAGGPASTRRRPPDRLG
jgi:exonuclease III